MFKLTQDEGLALIGELEKMVGTAKIAVVLTAALGPERTARLVIDREAVPLTRAEKIAIIDGVVPLIPGATLRDKVRNVGKAAQKAFTTKERFLEAVAYVKERIKRHMAETANGGTPEQPSPEAGIAPTSAKALPAIGSKFLVFWMPVNNWSNQGDARLLAYIDECAKYGVHFGIEMAGWADTSCLQDPAKLKETIRLYKVALARCRANGQWMLNSILNNNSHINKHGNSKPYTFTSVWPAALQLLDCVKQLGPANQIIQPAAELQTPDGIRWHNEVVKALPGFHTCYNGSGGRPGKAELGSKWFAHHPQKTSAKVPRGCLAVSDCGTIILQLQDGYAGKGKPTAVYNWALFCAGCGSIAAGEYAFKYAGPPDTMAIRALALAAAKINGGTVAPTTGDDIDMSRAAWVGPNGRAAKVTESLVVKNCSPSYVYFQASKGTEAWQPFSDPPKPCNQYSCGFVIRNGVPTGGKWDWCTYSRTNRPLSNIYNGYIKGVAFKAGEPWYMLLMDLNGTRRTTCKYVGPWPKRPAGMKRTKKFVEKTIGGI